MTVRPRLIALIVACAMFMAQLDSTIILTALPRMARAFGADPVDLSIGIAVYLLVQAALLPASGWVADRFGARSVFAAAMVGFVLASVLCGFSRNLPEFIGARVLQAAAAALMTPVGRMVMLRSVDKADLIRVMVIASTPMLVAPTIGPPLGGFITTYLDWSWVFFLNVPFGVLGVWLILRYIPDLKEKTVRRFDTSGFVLTAAAVAGVLYGLDRLGGSDGWIWPAILVLAGLALGAAAVRYLRRTPEAILSLGSFRSPIFKRVMIGGGFLARLPVRAAPFVLPLMFQIGMGMTAFQSGLLLLFFNAGDLVLKPMVTPTLRRFGFRNVLSVSAAGMALMAGLCATFRLGSPWLYMVAVLSVCGMFRSLLFTGMSSVIYADLPPEELSHATVIWNMLQHIGNAIGVSLAALLMHLSAGLRHAPPGRIELVDCSMALVVIAALGLLSAVSLYNLPADAGASLTTGGSQERPGSPAT